MNKAALWLGAAGVMTGMVMARPASAAEMFADVPTEHWAYQSVNELQERGIVIGYPDGTFGGKRAMTRYEFAVAIARLVDWVQRSIGEHEHPDGPVAPPSRDGLSEEDVRRLIDERFRDLPTRGDLETIRRLTQEFRDELTSLGTNVDALRRDLDSLKARVGAIEARLNKWHFSGEANAIIRGEKADRAAPGPGLPNVRRAIIDLDSRTSNNGTSDIIQDVKTLYSLDFGITGNVGSGVTANALLNFGNYLPWANASRLNPGVDANNGNAINGFASDVSQIDPVVVPTGPISPLGTALNRGRTTTQGNLGARAINNSFSEVTPVKLFLSTSVSDFLLFKNTDVNIGKIGVQFTPYTLQRVDPDSYTNVTLTDNGEYITTGASARTNIGGLHLNGYVGTHYVGRINDSSINTGDAVFVTYGGPTALSPLTYGGYPWDQSMGVHGTYQIGRFALGGTYITAGMTPNFAFGNAALPPFSDLGTYANRPNSNNGGRRMLPRRGEVYGGSLSFPLFGSLGFTGEFASSDILAGVQTGDRKSVLPSSLNNAYDAKLTYGAGRLSLAGGYKQVDPFFGAPGSWGNIGRWKNPNNIQGINLSAGYNFGGFTLKGSWADYNSVRVNTNNARAGFAGGTATGGFLPALSDNFENDLQHYKVGVSFNLSASNDIDLGYEKSKIQPFDTKGAGYFGQPGSGEADETYWTIGLGHRFNDNTLIKVLYQVVDYNDNGAGLYTVPGGNYKGGIGVGQLSVRF